MSGLITEASLFYMAFQAGWDNTPYEPSKDELKKLILSKAVNDHAFAEEVYFEIDESTLSPSNKKELLELLYAVTGGSKKEFSDANKARISKETTHEALMGRVKHELGEDNLICVAKQFFRYKSGVWDSEEDIAIRKIIQNTTKTVKPTYTKSTIDSVFSLLQADVCIPNEVFNSTPSSINCKNGEIVFEGADCHPKLIVHCRDHYHQSQIPYEYVPGENAELFLQYLAEAFQGCPDKDELIQLILEFIGYSLLTHCDFERLIILVGSGSNGKSVLLKVLENLLSRKNVCSIPPSILDHRFVLSGLQGKYANIVTETSVNETIADAKLKSLVSGELQTTERKGKDHFEFRPYATIWIATNYLPHTRDASDAFFRRVEIVKFPNKFEGDSKDPGLANKLIGELPGIFALSVDAISSAMKRKDFTQCASSIEAKKYWRSRAEPVAAFIDDCCMKDPSSKVTINILYIRYQSWSEHQGFSSYESINSFSTKMSNLGYDSSRSGSIRYKKGLALKS